MIRELLQVQESTMKSFFTSFMNSTNNRLDQSIRELQDVKTSLEFTQRQVDELIKFSTTDAVEKSDFENKIENFRYETDDLYRKVDDLENRSRRNNICFDGIPEQPNESWSDTEVKVAQVLKDKLQIKDFCIERAHRVGRKRVSTDSSKPRVVIAKFLNYKTREAVMANKKKLKGSNIYVREDFSEPVLEKRRRLIPQMQEARRDGKIAFLRYNKLITFPRSNPTSGLAANTDHHQGLRR